MKWLGLLAFGLVTSSVAVAEAAAAPGASNAIAPVTAADATGTWKFSFTRGNGQVVENTLKLKQDGEKLTGTTTGPNGNELEIKDGKVKDGNVSFKLEFNRDGQMFTVKYTAKLEGDSLKGKIEFAFDGEIRMRDFEAKREP
jgi:hypothetical protein